MRWIYRILRFLAVTLIIIGVAIPLATYVLLSLPPVQNSIRDVAQRELTQLLGTEVEIDRVNIHPFSAVTLTGVAVADPGGRREALRVGRLGAGIDFFRLLDGEIVVTYAEIVDLVGRLYRETPDSPLNIQPVIDRLSPKDKSKPPTRFDLEVATVVIRRSSISYDILTEPLPLAGKFDKNHIEVYDLKADISLPRLRNDEYRVDLRRLSVKERSGLAVNQLSLNGVAGNGGVFLESLTLELPDSWISLAQPLSLPCDSLSHLPARLTSTPFHLVTEERSHITPSDLAPFASALREISSPIWIDLDLSGTIRDLSINSLRLSNQAASIEAIGDLENLIAGPDKLTATLSRLKIAANMPALTSTLHAAGINVIPDHISRALGDVTLEGEASLMSDRCASRASLRSAAGDLDFEIHGDRLLSSLKGHIDANAVNAEAFLPALAGINALSVNADIEASKLNNPSLRSAMFDGVVDGLAWKGNRLQPLSARIFLDGPTAEGQIVMEDPLIDINADGALTFEGQNRQAYVKALIHNFNPHAFGLTEKYEDYSLSAIIDANLTGSTPEDIEGRIEINNLTFAGPVDKPSLLVDEMTLASSNADGGHTVNLYSDFAEMTLSGVFSYAGLAKTAKAIAAAINPELLPDVTPGVPGVFNDVATFHASIAPDNSLTAFFGFPYSILAPIDIDATIDGTRLGATLSVDAPYLSQKDKLIEGTSLAIELLGSERRSSLVATSTFPAKGGRANLRISDYANDGIHDSEIAWLGEAGVNHGSLRTSTAFEREDDGDLLTTINIKPSRFVFGDTVWSLSRSRLEVVRDRIEVNNLEISHDDQLLSINGAAGNDSLEVLTITLRDINLDYVFETLQLSDAVVFGGDATGTFHASRLFTPNPEIFTDDLHVVNLSYNRCVMGDGDLKASFDLPEKKILIYADVRNRDGGSAIIDGSINPFNEGLDFTFNADRAPVGFLQPFMAAFCNRLTGKVSGTAHLYGNFHDIDMTGRVKAENLAMTLGITGTTYYTDDSVAIDPGIIVLRDITLRDRFGNTALLSGRLTHDFFHDPVFSFNIRDARNLLCYDVEPNREHPWYGKVFGSGSASIDGRPGIVEINVNMATTDGTDFTFVLSDEEVAAEYTFLTFRDATPVDQRVVVQLIDTIPPAVRAIRERVAANKPVDRPSDYSMVFNIDITPQARVNLIMDPVGGDRIRARGHGNMRMVYNSADEDLRMYGDYTLERGDYNFTLQDIIVKDFTIDDGSSIAFHGNPYNAQLDIRAHYALTANLTDLDESFGQDRELTRTNVPVHAILYARGDMRAPELSFDLEFPTLSPDTYRKVRSIVSTDEMMSQQIIYLLALNRFYTPEYMTATRGNELVSVASSTLSSRLSSMLGQLSDKFTIAPTIRSDRGDFSDVEVDVALSSALLNNRLLLNGTFGYRDNTLNTNQFIGDFDIEYLLNRAGSIRLKAYNRYNDRNYYLKSALTTQGVGIVFKRDFDNIFSFLKPLRRRHSSSTDSLAPTPDESPAPTPTPQE